MAQDALQLLNGLQHDFPLAHRPFEAVAGRLGLTQRTLLERLRDCRREGQLSRIGAVWASGAGGAAALCALAVPPDRLEAVAQAVNAHPGVNHNYEREHAWNLWYVLTGLQADAVRAQAQAIAQEAGCPALFLPMVRAYRIDLGFDLRRAHAGASAPARPAAQPVADHERPLAALAEAGLPLVPRPFETWAGQLGWQTAEVLRTLRHWKQVGTLRRFGAVVRHHEFGFSANAMTVIRAPEGQADAIGRALATQPGVTLAYRRQTDPRWPYDLYFMVHARERSQAQALIVQALAATGCTALPHATLFGLRRFKQTGGRYFSGPAVHEEYA